MNSKANGFCTLECIPNIIERRDKSETYRKDALGNIYMDLKWNKPTSLIGYQLNWQIVPHFCLMDWNRSLATTGVCSS